jgi:hypothetical protein
VRRDDLEACFPGLLHVVLATPADLIGTRRSV